MSNKSPLEMKPGQKLDDLPKGRPHTYDEVMAAMDLLHKLVLKQAQHYGGKNSKLYLAQVVEGSLLQQVAMAEAGDVDKDFDEVDRLLDITDRRVKDLADHLKAKDDEKGLKHLGAVINALSAAISISTKHAKK